MDYYRYDSKQLVQNPKMSVVIMDENERVFQEIAQEMVETVEQNNAVGDYSVLIVPVGPVGHYPYFVNFVNERKVSLKNTWFINMDEYLEENEHAWINIENPLSFRKFMNEQVYAAIDEALIMPESQRIFPDPQNVEKVGNLLNQLKKVDLVIGGIGINGHVAFNEPDKSLSIDEYLQLPTRVQEIALETRVVNAVASLHGAFDVMPKMCVTVGMKEIYSAKKIRLGVFRDWHRAVIRKALHTEPTTEFPVSLLQSHPDIKIYCTHFVAHLPE